MAALRPRLERVSVVFAVLTLLAVSTQAAENHFYVYLNMDRWVDDGWCDGKYPDWYYYANTDWWNQWFYNGPYDPDRKKTIEVSLMIEARYPGAVGFVEIAYNWSTPEWSELGKDNPPLPRDVRDLATENKYIKRHVFFEKEIAPSAKPVFVEHSFEISDYNPEYVSIDVRGYGVKITQGWIKHVCVPKDETQACCLRDGGCANLSPEECKAKFGVPQGPGTVCTNPRPCCLQDGTCIMVDPLCCDDMAGTASPTGAARCLGDGNNNGIDDACEQEPTECAPTDDGQGCLQVTCPNSGDICLPTKIRLYYQAGAAPRYTVLSCACQSPNLCHVAIDPPDNVYCVGGCPSGQECELHKTDNGDGSFDYECECMAQPEPNEACCLPDGTCEDLTITKCREKGGTPQGPGTDCASVVCPQPLQACCLADGTCIDAAPDDCTDQGGTPQGPGTNCNIVVCPAPSECDWNPGDPHKMHHAQLPDLDPTGVAFALHPISGYADDFLCAVTGPILDIHIWGAFKSDILPAAGPGGLTLELTIYSNVPADDDKPYSRPGTRLWARRFAPDEYMVRLVHEGEQDWWENGVYGEYLKGNHKQTYQYNFCIDEKPFTQEKGTIYWLEVKDIRPDNANYKFGWKTTRLELRWNDDAVWHHAGSSLPQTYPDGHRYQGQTLDLAFVITGEAGPPPPQACCFDDGSCQNLTLAECAEKGGTPQGAGTDCATVICPGIGGCVWNVGDPHKMHFAQLPNPQGYDVDVTAANVLADDWKCSMTGPVTDIHFWYSWQGDQVGLIDNIHVSIHADDRTGPYSKPGALLWERDFGPEDFDLRYWGEGIQRFLLPPDMVSRTYHRRIYQCNICNIPEAFIQIEGRIYWLDISIKIRDPLNTHIGWKTSLEHFEDDAAYDAGDGRWAELIDPITGVSLDLAFVITGEEGCGWNPGEPYKMHFPQLPDPCGWDLDVTAANVSADDWLCTETGPVTDVHFWYSWLGDKVGVIDNVHVSIHADDRSGPYSKPAELLWERDFGPDEFSFCYWGKGLQGFMMPGPSHIQANDHKKIYQCSIVGIPDPFIQKRNKIYWLDLSIKIRDPLNTHIGWKTSIEHFEDDAVFDAGPEGWNEWREPFTGESLDMAFVITSEGLGECDWYAGDPHKMHWPQLPDLGRTGMDVDMFWTQLADDFKCTAMGPIKDIHIWGSFADDILPAAGPGSLTFNVTIYTDIPAGKVKPWSMPGEPVWSRVFEPGQYTVRKVHEGREDWYDPATGVYLPANHRQAYQYNFCVEDEPFVQAEGSIYWLEVKDIPPADADPAFAAASAESAYTFGWKTTTRRLRWNDDAVWGQPDLGWQELRFPDGHPYQGQTLDLAFVITGGREVWPEHDLGDAPDGSNSWPGSPVMTAYAGVKGKFPTVYRAGSPPWGPIHWQPRAVAYLGNGVSLENEADVGPDEDGLNNIDPPNDNPNQDKADDGVQIPLTLPHCQQTTFKYTVTVVPLLIEPPDLYANVWFDWNRDGDWNDVLECPDGTVVPEWTVQNQLLQFVTSGTYDITTPSFMCWHPPVAARANPIWMRITLSERQWGLVASADRAGGDGPPAGYDYGETEDYYFVPTEEPPPPELDFGDAPDPTYPTLLASNGARHVIRGPWLGGANDQPDAEAEGQPDGSALGDDNDGNDDENGIHIPSLVPGQTVNIVLEVNHGGVVQGWIDFSGDGSWQAGERVVNQFLGHGAHIIPVPVPITAAPGQSFARFRISSRGGLGPAGQAIDGEVEDHEVDIKEPPPKPFAEHLKWSQPPIEIAPLSKTPLYCGWDEPSWAARFEPDLWFDCWDCPTQCYGDVDCDGDADIQDIHSCAAVWNTQYGDSDYDPCADFDRNQQVDIRDLMICASHWGTGEIVEPPCPPKPERQRWHLVADDFRCLGDMPITSVHWWGSYNGWDSPESPPVRPIAWRIGFWSNVPANPLVKPGHSHPRKLLWLVDVPAERVHEQWAGIDRFPERPSDTCFQYYVQFEPDDYFWQHDFIDPDTEDDVFWISITAIYPGDVSANLNIWGWKTRPWHWMDDAIRFALDGAIEPGIVADPIVIAPIEDASVCEAPVSYDMAFELDTDPNYIKWEQPFTGIRQWRHYEDEASIAIERTTVEPVSKYIQKPDLSQTGIDVDATTGLQTVNWLPQRLADDFPCTTTGSLTDVHLWGSWYNDEPPGGDPSNALFRLSIYKDIPASDSLAGYSMPGEILWRREFHPGQFAVQQIPTNVREGYYNPCGRLPGASGAYDPQNHFRAYKYNFYIDPAEAFKQEGSLDNRIVYWLGVQAQAVLPGGQLPDARFGWKTSLDRWNDDAVWQTRIMPISRPWEELRYPAKHPSSGKSIDLAFEITGEKKQEELIIRRLVADDWLCQRTTPVTAVVWWGSYIGYRIKPCQCNVQPPPVRPDYFLLSIWSNVPASDEVPYSHPREKLWEYKAHDYDEVLVGYDKHPQVLPLTHVPAVVASEPVFRYSARLPKDAWFCQKDVNDIYWLSVAAVYVNPPADIYPWGWTNHKCTAWEPPGLVEVAHWKMDETAGSTAHDSSGNGNHGRLFGDPVWQPCCGAVCGALDLDGDGDYVRTADTTNGLNFAPNSFSASAWINARKVADGWRTIVEYDRMGDNWFGLWLNAEGRFHFRVGRDARSTNQKLNADEWYLVTGTYDSTDKRLRLYINGQFDSSTTQDKGFFRAPVVSKLTIGVRGWEDEEYFDGLIDDVRIYDSVLSPADIKALANMRRNDDAVAGHMDTTSPTPVWRWEELHDQTGMSEDMSFVLFTEPGCLPCSYSTYNDWLALGKPDCWCEPYQCDGDVDGATETVFNFRIYGKDLAAVVENWKRKIDDPLLNPCADVDHKPETFFNFRVYGKDLATVVTNWKKKDTDLPGDCPRPE